MRKVGVVDSWFGLTLGLVLGAASFACSVDVDAERTDAGTPTTRAIVAVTRSAPAAAPEDARAEAFAGFLRTATGADAKSALGLAGLALDLPAAGECRRGTRSEASRAGVTAVELLEAGEVTVAAGGSVTTLAPRAFPTITDTIAGVVYTTRDRAAAPLPAATTYTVAASGGSSLEAVSGFAQAPALLADVTLGGEPLGHADVLAAHRDLALEWAPGASGDRIYVEFTGAAEPTLCTFADEAGHGSVPGAVLPVGATAVAVHRLRETPFADAGLKQGALRFDFELSASVTFE